MTTLYDAYLRGDSAVHDLFGRKMEFLAYDVFTRHPWPAGLRDALEALQPKLGGSPAALDGDEPVVVTGQQPGLFLGPLFTVYKAVTAIRLARLLSERHGKKVLPVFWIASEDHDFEEVRRYWFTDTRCELHERAYAPADPLGNPVDVEGFPMHRVPAGFSLRNAIDEMASLCVGSEHTAAMKDLLHDTLAQAPSVSNWFARLMAVLFRDTGLVLFAPHMRVAREAARSVIRREIEMPGVTGRLLSESAARVRALGFTPAIVRPADACNFFLFENGRRRRVVHTKQGFVLPEEHGKRYAAEELLDLLEEDPTRFSPNVALRPVAQQVLFPGCRACVAGPGEIAYWAQLKPIFEWYEVPMPVVFPRARARFVTPKEKRRLRDLGLRVEELGESPQALFERVLRREPAGAADRAVDAAREQIAGILDRLGADLAGAGVRQSGQFIRDTQAQVHGALEQLARRIRLSDTRRADRLREQIAALRNRLRPMGRPQERVLSPFTFLFSQGPALIQRLISELRIDTPEEQEIEWL
ncbi:MAG TPA: bacillithiol biosynthesis cysteine-adding enzyme BshC [Candidatus Hydrogenedentes bacterium]|nr:bacillithiol biosynthesis cysteine-adding enzyme BshC [Candidatus Hydrogenedentota bacterium]